MYIFHVAAEISPIKPYKTLFLNKNTQESIYFSTDKFTIVV